MKNIKAIVLLFAFSLCAISFAQSKKEAKGVYLFGVAGSFTDSIVYVTDVQFVADAQLDNKGLLMERAVYSNRLKSFVEQEDGLSGRTAAVFYHKKKSSLEKKLKKIKGKYRKSKVLILHEVPAEFKFEKTEKEE